MLFEPLSSVSPFLSYTDKTSNGILLPDKALSGSEKKIYKCYLGNIYNKSTNYLLYESIQYSTRYKTFCVLGL